MVPYLTILGGSATVIRTSTKVSEKAWNSTAAVRNASSDGYSKFASMMPSWLSTLEQNFSTIRLRDFAAPRMRNCLTNVHWVIFGVLEFSVGQSFSTKEASTNIPRMSMCAFGNRMLNRQMHALSQIKNTWLVSIPRKYTDSLTILLSVTV